MEYVTKKDIKMKKRHPQSHKGDFGRVLVIGGSVHFAGAPILAALAAEAVLRSGADVVTVAAPSKVAWVVNTIKPDIITKKFSGEHFTMKHLPRILKLAEKHDILLIGPGIGRKSDNFIKAVVREIRGPKIIDADAIKCISLADVENAILTPHKEEFRLLMQNSRIKVDENNIKYSELRDKICNNVILLKSKVDVIISKGTIKFNRTGNAVMTKAGTGDVLAGLCAGFLAQTNDTFKSACMGAYINGKVGDYLLHKYGRTFIASDLIKNLHKVYR